KVAMAWWLKLNIFFSIMVFQRLLLLIIIEPEFLFSNLYFYILIFLAIVSPVFPASNSWLMK
ncbi:MAG: hypothetical protein N3G18_07440, partial [Candidatus Saccharicenans sp.]|nr:hypothetical protein [Candidatus Saccharicenans sp.]